MQCGLLVLLVNNQVEGMPEDRGYRVMALIGGEPLLRPQMAHKIVHYAAKKGFWVHIGIQWPGNCRGQNIVTIHTRDTLGPCLPMYSGTYDWWNMVGPKFAAGQLAEMKQTCQKHCFSTLNHNLADCYTDARVLKW